MNDNNKKRKRKRRFIHDFLGIDMNGEEKRSHMVLTEYSPSGNILSMNIIEMPEPVLRALRYQLFLN